MGTTYDFEGERERMSALKSGQKLSLVVEFAWGRPKHQFGPDLDVLNNVVGRGSNLEHLVTVLAGGPPTTEIRDLMWSVNLPGTNKAVGDGHGDASHQFRIRGLEPGRYDLHLKATIGRQAISPVRISGCVVINTRDIAALTREGKARREWVFESSDKQAFKASIVEKSPDGLVLVIEGNAQALVDRLIRFTISDLSTGFRTQGFVGLYGEGRYRGETVLNAFVPDLGTRGESRVELNGTAPVASLTHEDAPALRQSAEAAKDGRSRNQIQEAMRFATGHSTR